MTELDEIEAMKIIAAALEPLPEDARHRALQWAVSRYRGGRSLNAPEAEESGAVSGGQAGTESAGFGSFAELFEASNPVTDREKALAAAYWVQVCENQQSFASQTLNSMLKDLGYGVSNITEALTALKSERPALVLQLKKSGTSRQARKTYKLTAEGVRRIQTMVRDAGRAEE